MEQETEIKNTSNKNVVQDDTDDAESDSDIDDMKEDDGNLHRVYKVNFWPSKPEKPKGFTFKGKHKLMT